MAIIWRVKDGPSGNTTDVGTTIPMDEATSRLEDYTCKYLSEGPPAFNVETPSDYYQHVVVEVTADDVPNEKFRRRGFYVVADLDASQSAFLTVLEANEKKCPNPRCGSQDVYFQGAGVGVGVGEKLPAIQKHLFKCRACEGDFWYTGRTP